MNSSSSSNSNHYDPSTSSAERRERLLEELKMFQEDVEKEKTFLSAIQDVRYEYERILYSGGETIGSQTRRIRNRFYGLIRKVIIEREDQHNCLAQLLCDMEQQISDGRKTESDQSTPPQDARNTAAAVGDPASSAIQF